MEIQGKLIGASQDWETGRMRLMFEVEDKDTVFREYDKLVKIAKLDIVAKPHREKRSLNANAYFHLLVSKLADALNTSKPRMKNLMLARYGQAELDDDGMPVIWSMQSKYDDSIAEMEEVHLTPIGTGFANGKEFTHWKVLRGSHTYNTQEMATLIDGVVMECKEQGIETMTPDEIARLTSTWRAQ